jgi:pimeloyl-ACP methyl ester carboxylesterase
MPDSERTTGKRQWHCEIWSLGLTAAPVAALEGNMIWVDSRTRPASPRDGGEIIDTDIEPVNVKVDGDEPPILLLHGFGPAIDWWDDIAPALASHHRVIRLDLIEHGGTAAPTRGSTSVMSRS